MNNPEANKNKNLAESPSNKKKNWYETSPNIYKRSSINTDSPTGSHNKQAQTAYNKN